MTTTPGNPPIVDRATWQAARQQLLVREKAHTRMIGEEILRGLAEEFAQELARSRPEHQESVRLNARPYLTGAYIALFRAEGRRRDH